MDRPQLVRPAVLAFALVVVACRPGGAAPPAVAAPAAVAAPDACDATQARIRRDADARAAPWSLARHLDANFADRRIAWLMPEAAYAKYIVEPQARSFGRCDATACYLFAAPAATIHAAVAAARVDGGHDPAVLGQALGLPAANLTGPLRMMTLDVAAAGVCVRLPVEDDPGVWKCASAADTDCFKFGGYTSGGVPEVMAIDVPVAAATIELVP